MRARHILLLMLISLRESGSALRDEKMVVDDILFIVFIDFPRSDF